MARSELKGQAWVAWFFLAFACLAVAYFVIRFSTAQWLELTIGAAIAGACSLAAIDVLFTRVCHDGDSIVIRRLFSVKRVPLRTVRGVTWEKGCPVAIQLDDDSWLQLPDHLLGGPGTVATVRAWLAQSRQGTG